MRKIFALLFVLSLTSFTKNNEQDVKRILTSGKWFVESVQESGQEPEMSSNKNDEWIVFHAEGKLEESLYGEVTNSEWEYSDKEKSIKVVGDDIVFKKIIEISEDKLTIELIEDVNNKEDVIMINYIK